MGKCLKFYALLLGAVLVCGCAAQKSGSASDEREKAERFRHSYEAALEETAEYDASTGKKLVKNAHKAIGTPYVMGGSSLGGFDCSGFVSWAYNSIGVKLPRTAREQSVIGKKIKNIEDMRAGDIVAFKHPKRGYHTGIYVGDGKFIHSPRKRTRVRINSLDDPYFSNTLLGARRVKLEGTENLVAQAESRLEQFAAAKQKSSLFAKDKPRAVADNKTKNKAAKVNKARKNSSKTVASAKNAKNRKSTKIASKRLANSKPDKKQLKSLAQHSRPAKASAKAKSTVASRKSNQKTVSMLQQKNSKRAAKTRSHS